LGRSAPEYHKLRGFVLNLTLAPEPLKTIRSIIWAAIVAASTILYSPAEAGGQTPAAAERDAVPVSPFILVGTNSSSATNAFALRADVRRDSAPGMRTATRLYITSGNYKFGVEIPDGYKLQTSAPDQITLVTADLSSFLVFQIAGKFSEEAKTLKHDLFRDRVLDQHNGAKILEEFILPAAGTLGAAFDLQVNGIAGIPRKARVTFVPNEAGTLEFTVIGNADKFKAALADFHTLVLTFRTSDRNGNLEMPALPLKI
jgi:hypothetical protein